MAVSLLKLAIAAAGALAGAAVARELDKPAEDREWHGNVGGIPYDFRPPTVEKLRRSAWDPDNPHVLVPHAFGVGWSINFARVAALVQPPQPVQPPAEQKAITGAGPAEITDGASTA
jgi:hypothetical protein